MKNILVVKLSAIGDVIHALPVSYAIKETYPDAHLTWVVEPPAYPLLEGNPYIDELILFEKAKFRSIGGFLREYPPLRRRLRARRYDVSLDLQGLFKSAAIVYTAGVRERVARAIGCRVDAVRFPITVSDRDRMAAETLLQREGVPEGRTFVAFAVGANWPNKRWPAEHFAALGDRLYEAHIVPVLVGGGHLDATIAADIMAAARIPPVNLVGRTNLKQLAHLFTRAALVLGGDTGPVHLAAGLGRPTVMLMGPTDANRNGPYGQQENAIEVDRSCRGCWKRTCPKGLDCLAAITVDEVAEKIGSLLRHVRV